MSTGGSSSVPIVRGCVYQLTRETRKYAASCSWVPGSSGSTGGGFASGFGSLAVSAQ